MVYQCLNYWVSLKNLVIMTPSAAHSKEFNHKMLLLSKDGAVYRLVNVNFNLYMHIGCMVQM